MALDRTAGFDMLVQVSEAELNTQLATAFLAGTIFPSSLVVPVNTGGIVGEADLNFHTPIADLDRPRPRIGLTVPFFDSQLQITSPIPATLAPLGGTITIVDGVEMLTQGSSQIATMDFATAVPDVSVAFDAASQVVLAPALAAAGLTLAQAQNMLAGMVIEQLQTGVGRIDLTPAISVFDDADPTTIFDIDVTTVNDVSAADRDCLAFGVRMANDSGGNVSGITSSFIPTGSQSLVMMSNFWLLARVMRPRVAASLGLQTSDFDTPLRLNHSVMAPGGQGTLTNLEAFVEGNRIRVDGRATASGTGWSAVSTFTFFIDIALAGGAITVTATTPTVHTDVDLEWWVWLVSLGLGGLFGGIVGVIVAAIVLAIIEAVAGGIVDGLLSGGISGALGGIPAIPLGPIGGGLTLSSVVLDDFELRGSIVRSVSVPVKSQGSLTAAARLGLDLDDGLWGSTIVPGTDLICDPSTGITTNGSARLSLTGASFGALGPVELSQLPMASVAVPAALIPLVIDLPFFGHTEAVFAVRTSDGRFAKVRAWRSLLEGGALHVAWITYDTPVPRLDIAARWSVIEHGPASEYITPNCEYCRSRPVRWCGVFEAWPRLASFPIDYQWCLCGTVLEEGEGEVQSPSGLLAYRLHGRRLCIETEMGQSVDCELCVSAIDARGRELFTCIHLAQPGVEIHCRKCVPAHQKYAVQLLPPAAELAGWRPLIAVEAEVG